MYIVWYLIIGDKGERDENFKFYSYTDEHNTTDVMKRWESLLWRCTLHFILLIPPSISSLRRPHVIAEQRLFQR